MNPRTTLLLFLVVALLGGAVWWQTQREREGEFDHVEALFEGLDPQRLVAIRMDNLVRSSHFKFERAPGRGWVITDPISYPADEGIMRVLVEAIVSNVAVRMAEAELPLAERAFDPPRCQLEVTERFGDGSERRSLIEIGEHDIDGRSVWVRKGERYFKTLRNLDTCLQHTLDRYRSKQVFDLDIRRVTTIRRAGSVLLGEVAHDVGMVLERRGIDWTLSSPSRVLADPETVGLYLSALATMRVEEFMSEDLSFAQGFGLDQPELEIELETADGLRQKVFFGRTAETGHWFAYRDGFPHIWMLEEGVDARLAMAPSQFFNLELVRTLRSAVELIELIDEDESLRITRDEERWQIANKLGEGAAWSAAVPAESERVEALLSRLESVRLTRYLLELSASEAFPPDAPARALYVTQMGERTGGRVGGTFVSDEGSRAIFFKRDEDRLVGLLPIEFESVFDESMATLRSRRMWALDEVDLRELELSNAQVRRQFRRSRGGVWQYMDMDAEALELRPVLDSLFFLRAESFLPGRASELAALEGALELRITDRRGKQHLARIGLDGEGAVQVEVQEVRARLADQELHERLLKVLDAKAQPSGG